MAVSLKIYLSACLAPLSKCEKQENEVHGLSSSIFGYSTNSSFQKLSSFKCYSNTENFLRKQNSLVPNHISERQFSVKCSIKPTDTESNTDSNTRTLETPNPEHLSNNSPETIEGSSNGDLNSEDQFESSKTESQGTQKQNFSLDDVNPLGLGRKSRQLFDDVWSRLVQLGQLSRPPLEEQYESVLIQGPNCDFTIENAEYTTVLVAGATGRVGRVLVRKLLLRGYTVKALVREGNKESAETLPRSVQIVYGDVSDPRSLEKAVENCTKIIYCAAARSSLSAEIARVENTGVYNLAKAFMDYNNKMARKRAGRSSKSKLTLINFGKINHQSEWKVKEGNTNEENVNLKYDGGMDGSFEISEKKTGVFSGYVFTKGGYLETVKELSVPDNVVLDRYEGIVMSICGDGKAYSMILETENDKNERVTFFARFNTKLGYSRIRIPFSSFRTLTPSNEKLNPSFIKTIAFRFEPRKMRPTFVDAESGAIKKKSLNDPNSFRLEIDHIKAFPGGQETDFVLVSCSGMSYSEDIRERAIKSKMAGENAIRNSGLGYTIVRPGPLQEEPGGQRALIFDQGNRLTQGIGCADVADVCVKSLHDPMARNKSFDICYEYMDQKGLYELVAHLPDKANNYLTPALALLEKNT